jgi:hypothetical protein
VRVYVLHIAPDPTEEGADNDLWFSSKTEVLRKRRELIKAYPEATEPDYEIEEVVLAKLPTKKLVLALLNRTSFAGSRKIVVAEYTPHDPEYER